MISLPSASWAPRTVLELRSRCGDGVHEREHYYYDVYEEARRTRSDQDRGLRVSTMCSRPRSTHTQNTMARNRKVRVSEAEIGKIEQAQEEIERFTHSARGEVVNEALDLLLEQEGSSGTGY